MIVIVGNQKGGVGKTTISVLLANYLASNSQMDVTCFDFDFQKSLYDKFEMEKKLLPENEMPFQVASFDLDESEVLLNKLEGVDDEIFLFDLPGRFDDNRLIPFYLQCDLLICPFYYDKSTFHSTLVFIQIVDKLKKKYNPDMKIFFLPNRVKSAVKYKLEDNARQVLSDYGEMLPSFPDRVIFERNNIFGIPESIKHYVDKAFDVVVKEINI